MRLTQGARYTILSVVYAILFNKIYQVRKSHLAVVLSSLCNR